MSKKVFLLVCEGETDVYIFEEIARHLSSHTHQITIYPLAPQIDATSGSYERYGYGDVLNWCLAHHNDIEFFLDFKAADGLLIHLDTDISNKINPGCSKPSKVCCEEALTSSLNGVKPNRCHYILAVPNTEVWILASHDDVTMLDSSLQAINNYEHISDVAARMIDLGYPSKKGKNSRAPRKLNKTPAKKYKGYAKKITSNLTLARSRCSELESLCTMLL
jgi:hypothetical protein